MNLQSGAAECGAAVAADKMSVRYRRWRAISEANEDPWFSGFSTEKGIATEGREG